MRHTVLIGTPPKSSFHTTKLKEKEFFSLLRELPTKGNGSFRYVQVINKYLKGIGDIFALFLLFPLFFCFLFATANIKNSKVNYINI